VTPDALPLSDCQSGYLAATAGDPADPVHNTALPLLFDAPVSAKLLHEAVAALMARHAMLCTAMRLDPRGSSGEQWTIEPQHWWQEVDASGLDRHALLARAGADLRRPFAFENGLFRATLYQGAEPGPLLLLALHHIAGDAPSWGILGRELVACYAALAAGRPIELPPLPADHADYLRWERDLLAADKGGRMARYWQAQLAGDLPLLRLPTDHPRPPTKTFNGSTLGLRLPDALTRDVQALSGALSCTRFAVLLSAWLLLLHQWTGQDDVWLLVPSSMPRQQPRFRGVVGLLISPLIVRLRVDQVRDQGFAALARAVNGQLLLGLHHQPYPVTRLLEGRTDPAAGGAPVALRSMSAWEHSDFIPRRFTAAGIRAERCDIPQLDGLYDAGLTFLEDVDTQAIGAGLSYSRDLFTPETIDRLAARFLGLLERATAAPEQPINRHFPGTPCAPTRSEGAAP
jgi:hypothetical protein